MAQPGVLTVLEMEVETTAGVEAMTLPDPISDFDMAGESSMPFCDAQAEAQIVRSGPVPGCWSRVTSTGNAIGPMFSTQVDIQLDRIPFGHVPPRTASGSWRERMVFELHRPMNAELFISQGLFDESAYTEYEPGRLTGPDGVIVEGSLGGGAGWVWELSLRPGVYTYEAYASYDIDHAMADGLSERATHGMRLLVYLPDCRADMDGDGSLSIFDFLQFQNLFDAGDDRADFDGDGDLTVFDFLAFQNAFDAGCE